MSTATLGDGQRERQDESFLKVVELYLAIRAKSLFSLIASIEARALLRESTTYDSYPAGAALTQRGGGTELTIVAEGVVGLYLPGKAGDRVAEVIAGRSIELDRVLSAAADWQFRWVAETEVRVLRVDAGELLRVLRRNTTLEVYLRKITASTPLQKLARDLRLFGFSAVEIQRSIAMMEPIGGTDAGRAGLRNVLVVVSEGELVVKTTMQGASKTLSHVTVGDYTYFASGAADDGIEVELAAETQLWVLDGAAWAAAVGEERCRAFARVVDTTTATKASLESLLKAEAVVRKAAPVADEVDDGLTVADFSRADDDRVRPRKPVNIRQHDQMDCGAACLAMVAAALGRRISIATFRNLVQVTREGASMLSLKKGAERVGLEAIGIASGPGGLASLRPPFIALMQYHFVVVFEATDTGFVVSDPGAGVHRLTPEDFAKEYSGNVLALRATPAFFEFPESRSKFRKYLGVFRGHGGELVTVGLAAVLTFALGLTGPLLQQYLFDSVLGEGKLSLVNVLALGMLTLRVTSQLISWVESYLITRLTSRIDAKFSALFIRHMYSLPLSYFAVRRVGDFTSRLAELAKIRQFFTSKPVVVLINVASIVIYASVLGFYNWRFSAALGVVLPLLLGFIVYMTPKLTRNRELSYKAYAKNASVFVEHFRGIESLRANCLEIAGRWRWSQSLLEAVALDRKSNFLQMAFDVASTMLQMGLNTLLFVIGIYLFLNDEMTLGQVIAVTALANQVVSPAVALIGEWNEFHQIGVSLARVDDVITAAPEDGTDGAYAGAAFRGQIEFRGIGFQYGNEHSPRVLAGVSLAIAPGETVAFVGRSGSGKTTLAYMVNRLYAPTVGAVFVDGIDTATIPLAVLRRAVGVIMQENSLFSGTILENISLGDPHPAFDRALRAAKDADAHEFISKLKHGYSTRLSESGVGLSGGQKQRLNIARALYHNPPILIMDEATSALDAVTEQTIVTNVRAQERKRTTIIIAHRLNTVMHADRIVVLDHGRISEVGTHKELMAHQGLYYAMFKKQLFA